MLACMTSRGAAPLEEKNREFGKGNFAKLGILGKCEMIRFAKKKCSWVFPSTSEN